MIVHQFEGVKGDRDEFLSELESWKLSGDDEKYIKKTTKRVEATGTELIDNKIKYSNSDTAPFRYTIVQDEDTGKISAIWQEYVDATGERLERLKSKFENAVNLLEQGRTELRSYRKGMHGGTIENSEESISKGSAGLGFVDMALRCTKMQGHFTPQKKGFTKVSFKFDF